VYLSLVIPVYNESKIIVSAIEKVLMYFFKKGYFFEIIVVDDGSVDNTRELVRDFAKSRPNVILVSNGCNKGKGFSVKNGVLVSKGDYVLFSDADLSTPIAELDKLMFYFAQGYDVVIGSRALKGSDIILKQPWIRQNMGKVFNLLVRGLRLADVRDTQCGFKCFSRVAAEKIFKLQRFDRFCFDVEILYIAKRLGFKIKDVPVAWVNRIDSRVAIFKDSVKMFIDLFKIRINAFRGLYNAA